MQDHRRFSFLGCLAVLHFILDVIEAIGAKRIEGKLSTSISVAVDFDIAFLFVVAQRDRPGLGRMFIRVMSELSRIRLPSLLTIILDMTLVANFFIIKRVKFIV